MPELDPFPVDDVTLQALEHALDTAWGEDDAGKQVLVGGDMTVTHLLEFLSGPSPTERVEVVDAPVEIEIRTFPAYSEHDVIRALIAEIRRLQGPR